MGKTKKQRIKELMIDHRAAGGHISEEKAREIIEEVDRRKNWRRLRHEKEYQSREYCRDIKCGMMILLNNEDYLGKNPCDKCEAYKFHQWLQDNGYKIVKEV